MFIIGCSNLEKSYGAGYSDGYAVGYNTTCKIRRTLIYGHFNSDDYARGYYQGKIEGSEACKR